MPGQIRSIFLAGKGLHGKGIAGPGTNSGPHLAVATLPPPSLSDTMSGGVGVLSPKLQPNRPVGGVQ